MTDHPPGPFHNAYWVRPGQLMGGPHPHTRERVSQLLDAGITFFVDLTEPHELEPYALYLPPDVRYQCLSIRDMETPTTDHMIRILDTVDAAISGGQTVYVHCWAGLGRTGTVIGCYLARHGTTGQAALDEIARLRGGRTNSPQTNDQCYMVQTWRDIPPKA
jgi:protein-tyrosine phosphatase